jgi:hypothetical protein
MKLTTLLVSSALIICAPCRADPDDSILTTYSENGERQFDFKIGTFTQKAQPGQDADTLGLGYGLTDFWFSELYVGYAKTGSESVTFDSAALQNTFLLTGAASPVDLGLFTEIEYEHDRTAGEKFSFGPLLHTEMGLTQLNVNLIFRRNYFADFSNPMLLDYQWQVKRHIQAPVDIGLQGFGEFGQWNHFAARDQQSHRMGPVVFGKIDLGDEKVINYNAAILFDVLDDTHATTFRFQAVLGF